MCSLKWGLFLFQAKVVGFVPSLIGAPFGRLTTPLIRPTEKERAANLMANPEKALARSVLVELELPKD
jgi:hypothetical protein